MSNKDELFKWIDTNIPLPTVREFVYLVLKNTPLPFWERASSSTGKYHSVDEHGFEGLVVHTLKVCKVGKVLYESTPGSEWYTVGPACILHDIMKYPTEEHLHTVKEHPRLAANLILQIGEDNNIDSKVVPYIKISDAVRSHTGRWAIPLPEMIDQWLVHYADNIATKCL